MESSAFVDSSTLDVIVPQYPDLNLRDLVLSTRPTNDGGSGFPGEFHIEEINASALFSSIAQRTTLHFDERIRVYVVLKAPCLERILFDFYLKHLNVRLEAYAFGSSARNSGHEAPGDTSLPTAKDTIWSNDVDSARESMTVLCDTRAEMSDPEIYVIWKADAFLSRPKIRMHHPMITFRPFAVLRNIKPSSPFHEHDRCLPSGVPASINILESLRGEPGLQDIEAQISALRLSHVNTPHVSTTADLSVRLFAQKSFPAIPALSARVRYTKSSTPFGRSCTMATLDIETAPFQDDDIILTKVEMQYSGGTIEDLCSEQILKLPKTCRPKDHLAFLYRLHHNGELMHRDNTSSYSKSMTVVIEANVLVSETCKPKIQMKWKSNVDFSAPLNPSFVAPGQTMQRSKRPPSLPVTASNKSQSDPPQLSNAASSVEIGQQRHRAISTGHIGVTMTLTAPRDVYVGEPFTWDVFIVNGSSKPRKLAIVVIPKRSLADVKSHLAKRSSSSSASGRRGELELADATMDENRLYAMQKSAGREEVQIVSLSTEVRLGTLNPGFCHNAELKFLPLASGVLHIETIRVIDLVANESIDVRDLPEIVADDRNGNSRVRSSLF